MTPLSRRVEVEVAQSFSGGGLPAISTPAKTDPADLRLPTSGLACAVETRQALRRADVQIPAVAELQVSTWSPASMAAWITSPTCISRRGKGLASASVMVAARWSCRNWVNVGVQTAISHVSCTSVLVGLMKICCARPAGSVATMSHVSGRFVGNRPRTMSALVSAWRVRRCTKASSGSIRISGKPIATRLCRTKGYAWSREYGGPKGSRIIR